MPWNAQQNPTGYRSVGLRALPIDPLTLTTSAQDAREILRRLTRRSIPSTPNELPIAANARKADGFAPNATSAVV